MTFSKTSVFRWPTYIKQYQLFGFREDVLIFFSAISIFPGCLIRKSNNFVHSFILFFGDNTYFNDTSWLV